MQFAAELFPWLIRQSLLQAYLSLRVMLITTTALHKRSRYACIFSRQARLIITTIPNFCWEIRWWSQVRRVTINLKALVEMGRKMVIARYVMTVPWPSKLTIEWLSSMPSSKLAFRTNFAMIIVSHRPKLSYESSPRTILRLLRRLHLSLNSNRLCLFSVRSRKWPNPNKSPMMQSSM